jgi:hypothetical protein
MESLGKMWNLEAMGAIFSMKSELPHLKCITIAFFRGALPTWTCFSAEFAPGGLINTCTQKEKDLAWMATTNDANEGQLGHYRLTLSDKSTLSLHQYNAQAMFLRNDTIHSMNALFEDQDHAFIRAEAWHIDSSGLERERKRRQVEFHQRVVEMAKIRRKQSVGKQLKIARSYSRFN